VHVAVRIENASEMWRGVEVEPELPVLLRHFYERLDATDPCVSTKTDSSHQKAAKNPEFFEKVSLMFD